MSFLLAVESKATHHPLTIPKSEQSDPFLKKQHSITKSWNMVMEHGHGTCLKGLIFLQQGLCYNI